jgi:hypothetical protein
MEIVRGGGMPLVSEDVPQPSETTRYQAVSKIIEEPDIASQQ